MPARHPPLHTIGLMSGTSLDGVDGVVLRLDAAQSAAATAAPSGQRLRTLAHASVPLPAPLRAELLALNQPGGVDELHRAALAANALARLSAQVVAALLAQSGLRAANIAAIGAHGQTVRHRPQQFDASGYTLQLNAPALLAELTGIAVVADFRSRDVAAGGQGAPLVPLFHREVFARPGQGVAVLNLGGIANLSVLAANGATLGFDCGPGNVLMDSWCHQHTGQPYDDRGRWAASGQVQPALLERLRAEPFFAQPPPKSTGRDLFNSTWLNAHGLAATDALQQPRLADAQPNPAGAQPRPAGSQPHLADTKAQLADASLHPADVQATLLELTASTCADALRQWAQGCTQLFVCGGGAHNTALMQRLQTLLPGVAVASTAQAGLPPLQVEAAAFAWLAARTWLGLPGNAPAVTGAHGPRVLGAVYPA